MSTVWIAPFDSLCLDDVARVGGKTASLGELRRALTDKAMVPDGFAVTADAWRAILAIEGLGERLAAILAATAWNDVAAAREASAKLRGLVAGAQWPDGLLAQILDDYHRLGRGKAASVAVRSSATAEDLPGASFAGLHDSFLAVRGDTALEEAIRHCFASLFTERAIHYRNLKGFAHNAVALTVAVQAMVDASRGASGVIFTLDTESGCRDVVLITGVLGLGETLVQGAADPDEFLVHKPTLAAGHRAVLRHRIGAKQVRLIRDGARTRLIRPSAAMRTAPCLDDEAILTLADQAVAIESHYSRRLGRSLAMDIEWARDGRSGRLYIVQARPETAHSERRGQPMRYRLEGSGGHILLAGLAVGEGIAAGPVRIVAGPADLASVRPGDVIVAETTSPDWEPVMRKAAAIVTERGGRTCHAAIIARELGIAAIVGAPSARKLLVDEADVTVSCAEGRVGTVYRGRRPFRAEAVAWAARAKDGPAVLVNIADPDKAFRIAQLPVDGVGLARIEFIIARTISIHPMALLHPERIPDRRVRTAIAKKAGPAGARYFVERLAEEVAVIAAAFYPRPVIVRTSDFKTNEYRALLGGESFETAEDNPMIGLRGAARYAHPAYAEAFALECQALAKVRGVMGLDNVIPMIPFCRTLSEARTVLARMASEGLVRGEGGLKIYAMAEIPSNAVSIDAFAVLFDGFSIGSNDLTQLTLGIDRDSALLADAFDEEDPAVLSLIQQIIAGAHRHQRPCGLCGQGPSDRPGFADWLIAQGIDSLSLNPDSVPGFLEHQAAKPLRRTAT
ncbi:phosphoenolpyruvate synthase [Rhizorhabdus dicambivorans]|uniref:Phosphoenolpyruvate synthase n=1 Tax=Rhizorhabdus dicambivorans TaxID=1850238 RepID=A0A2A4FSL2_9SPHN|nr:phosphoenolpyruvate synthase [Rhizorhabdus dicambivorans]ATE63875.1 phosphoenolpyruvate synthase [Rhizorhabdus dicambivorans]PCE40710.1 phosphoenolpyruvate synthase [Rhizorhabdus dicambivorans]